MSRQLAPKGKIQVISEALNKKRRARLARVTSFTEGNLAINWREASPSERAEFKNQLGLIGSTYEVAYVEQSDGSEITYVKVDGKRYRVSDNGKDAIAESRKRISENYGTELAKLVKAFRITEKAMSGSSVSDPKSIWLDLGVELGVITEAEADKMALDTL